MDAQITRWLHEDHSDEEEAGDVVVPDLESDVEEDGIIEDFLTEPASDSSDDSSSEDGFLCLISLQVIFFMFYQSLRI